LGLVGEEDGDVVFDGIFEAAGFGDEVVAILAQFAVRDGADEEIEKCGIQGRLLRISDDPVGRGILFEFAGRAVAILEFGIFGADAGVCGDGLGDEDVAVDDGAGADEGFSAEDGGAGVDGDIIFEGGVSFGAAKRLAAAGGESAECDALVDLDVFADDRGFADDDAGAVIDEEEFVDGGAGVDVDAGDAVGVFGHDAGDEGDLEAMEFVGDAEDGDREEAGVGEDDFIGIGGGGVAVEGGLNIGGQERSQLRHGAEEFADDDVGGFVATGAFGAAACGLVADGVADLFEEFVADGGEEFADVIFERFAGEVLLAEVAREEELAELLDDLDDGIAVGEVAGVDVPGLRLGLVAGYEGGDEVGEVVVIVRGHSSVHCSDFVRSC